MSETPNPYLNNHPLPTCPASIADALGATADCLTLLSGLDESALDDPRARYGLFLQLTAAAESIRALAGVVGGLKAAA